MAELKAVDEQYEEVERVIVEDVLVRPAGYELFLTNDELRGLRSLIRTGVQANAIELLNLKDLSATLEHLPGLSVVFDRLAKIQGTV